MKFNVASYFENYDFRSGALSIQNWISECIDLVDDVKLGYVDDNNEYNSNIIHYLNPYHELCQSS